MELAIQVQILDKHFTCLKLVSDGTENKGFLFFLENYWITVVNYGVKTKIAYQLLDTFKIPVFKLKNWILFNLWFLDFLQEIF